MERSQINLWKLLKENVPFIVSTFALILTIAMWIAQVENQGKVLSAHSDQIQQLQGNMGEISTTLTVIKNNQDRDYQELKEIRTDLQHHLNKTSD